MFDVFPGLAFSFILVGIVLTMFLVLAFALMKGIYNLIHESGEKPALDYLKVMEEEAKLYERRPELFQGREMYNNGEDVAVKNTDTVSPKGVDAHKIMREHQKKRTSFGKTLFIFSIGALSMLVAGGGGFLLWLFW